ncbi:MAG TPA: inositol monophosphatase family protein [Nocardioidaceae bacterium]|nr:inositol monophosphatase family protein [Nocardioidaceae bacterium]
MTDGELLDLARSVALEAAALVRQRRRAGVEVAATKSSPVDVVTEADRAAEELIYSRLTRARPDDGFLGEEGYSASSASGVTWVVDPIDGTVNFLYDLPQYAVSIAASRDGEVVAGVVVNVASGEVFAASRGDGATLDGRPVRVREVVPLDQSLVATGFNYVREVRTLQAAAVARMLGSVRDVRRLGSAALDLCALAAGRLDGYVEEGLNAWDLAAGGLVAAEAGARVESLRGVGGTSCVVAAPTGGYAEFLDLVRTCGFLAGERE